MAGNDSSKSEPTADSILLVDEHVEEVSEDGKQVRHRGVYLLPNLFTTAALFCGFYGMIASIHGKFEHAAVAILLAMLFDGLDGRIARLTNTTSAFGVQYDSLSDMVSFGVAPAIVSFTWALSLLGKVGWSIAFLYATCAALRLARFNTQVDTADKNYFTGLASPAAAAIIASLVWVGADSEITMTWVLAIFICIVVCFAALLMVSNIKYYSFKGLDFKARVPFIAILALVLVVTLVHIDPPKVLLAITTIYALSGPVMHVYRKIKSGS